MPFIYDHLSLYTSSSANNLLLRARLGGCLLTALRPAEKVSPTLVAGGSSCTRSQSLLSLLSATMMGATGLKGAGMATAIARQRLTALPRSSRLVCRPKSNKYASEVD